MGERRACQHSHNGIRRVRGRGRRGTKGDSHLKKKRKNVIHCKFESSQYQI
jgi:hypothetical protein